MPALLRVDHKRRSPCRVPRFHRHHAVDVFLALYDITDPTTGEPLPEALLEVDASGEPVLRIGHQRAGEWADEAHQLFRDSPSRSVPLCPNLTVHALKREGRRRPELTFSPVFVDVETVAARQVRRQ